jgi:hypothetical protein
LKDALHFLEDRVLKSVERPVEAEYDIAKEMEKILEFD